MLAGDLEFTARAAEPEELATSEAGFAALYRRHQPALYRFALQMGARPQIAEEVVQEVFLELIRRPGHFLPSQGTVRGYLFGMGRNLLRNYWRRHRSETSWDQLVSEPDDQGRAALALDEQRDQGRQLRDLQIALAALPWRYREVLVICDLQEINYHEAARILGCRPGTVASRRHRGYKLLQSRLRRQRKEES